MNLSQLPKEIIAIVILVGGLAAAMIFDPPKTPCDVQIDLFKKSQGNFIFAQETKSGSRPPDNEKFLSRCQEANGPGGCFELFQHLKQFNHDFNAVPEQCQAKIASTSEVSRIFNQSIGVFIQLAWGYQAPLTSNQKQGWLDQSETYLFCLLKSDFVRLYGDETWQAIIAKNLKLLPGSQNIRNQQDLFQLSLASYNCK